MKKLLPLALTIVLCFSLVACGNKRSVSSPSQIEESTSPLPESIENIPNATQNEDETISTKVSVGEYITFGAYEQDNDTSNGKEPIEWLVLDIVDNRALLISKYALDCKPYNEEWAEDITWEECTLRTWLNNEFISEAFSPSEKGIIPTVTVTADDNPKSKRDAGNDTEDKAFLLSINEIYNYFKPSKIDCNVTEYAIANGAYADEEKRTCWWLRSPGEYYGKTALITPVICLSTSGHHVESDNAVRPALWVELD
ncbi:MAG: hypothetical protein IJO09_05980 [Oscillospiraceae bacterium]|nr:hypothetical protein [Oscillospiraceae bacterium]